MSCPSEAAAVRLPAGGENPQIHAHLIPDPQRQEIATHPGLASDHHRVFRVGLPVTAVRFGRVMDRATRDVKQPLVISRQQGNQQCRSLMVRIRRPHHLALPGLLLKKTAT